MTKIVNIIFSLLYCFNIVKINNICIDYDTNKNDTCVICYQEEFLDLYGAGVDYCISLYHENNYFFFDRYCDYYDLLKKHHKKDSIHIASMNQDEYLDWSLGNYYKNNERRLIDYYRDWRNHIPVNIHVNITQNQYDSIIKIIEYIKYLGKVTYKKVDGIDDVIISTGGYNQYIVMYDKDTITLMNYNKKIKINNKISRILCISPHCSICYKMYQEMHPIPTSHKRIQKSSKERKLRFKRKTSSPDTL